jgi:LuxR family maltose regulon positive regulatory protein
VLRQGTKRPLTVINAPPGFGKTTLLAQWAREDAKRMPFAWVTLAEDAQVPSTFLFYVIEALRSVDPSIGSQARRRLGGPGPDPAAAAMPALLNDLEGLPGRVALVLDDFDTMQEPESRRWMTFLLNNLAGPLHIVVATRSDPLLPLGRLRAQGDLTELGAEDLAFSADEANTLLRRHLGVEVSDEDLEALVATTEGVRRAGSRGPTATWPTSSVTRCSTGSRSSCGSSCCRRRSSTGCLPACATRSTRATARR